MNTVTVSSYASLYPNVFYSFTIPQHFRTLHISSLVTIRKQENAHRCISSHFYATILHITSPYLLRLQLTQRLLLYYQSFIAYRLLHVLHLERRSMTFKNIHVW